MISLWQGFWIILRKEVIDNCRDKRTLTTMGVSIALAPMIIFGFIWFAEKTVKEETDLINSETIQLPVIGAELAPNLMNWLRQKNIEIIASPENPAQSVIDGNHRVILVIEDSYVEAFSKGESAPLRLIHDSSISELESFDFKAVQSAILGYSGLIGSLRLQARGISPQIVRPITTNFSDVVSPEARNSEILTMLPYLIIIFIMVGGMYLAIDTTAGERENGSLEPLLTQPVERHVILLAKLGATVVFSALTFLLVLIGLAISFEYMPIESITISMDLTTIIKLFIICLPFVFVGCALMVLIASFTKSYKEAQSYLGMVMAVPSMPLIALAFFSPNPELANMWVPSLSQGLMIIGTLKGELIATPLIAVSMISSTAFAALVAFIAIKLYQRERILG